MADERIEAILARINTATEAQSTALTNVAEDIRRIKDTVTDGGAIDEIVTQLEAVAVKVEAQAAALTALDLENEPPAPTE